MKFLAGFCFFCACALIGIINSKKYSNRYKFYIALLNFNQDFKSVLSFRRDYVEKLLNKDYKFQPFNEILKQKIGLVVGSVLLIILSVFSTSFVWRVKVYGVNEQKLAEVNNVLERLNITPCSPKNQQKIKFAENEILKNVKGLSHVSISLKGTTVIINIKQAVLKEDVLGSE